MCEAGLYMHDNYYYWLSVSTPNTNNHLLDPHTWHVPSGYRCHTASSDYHSHCPHSTWSRLDSSYLKEWQNQKSSVSTFGNFGRLRSWQVIKCFLTLFIEFWTIWTEAFIMVPLSVPTLPWCNTATFTPDACHTNLHKMCHISTRNQNSMMKISIGLRFPTNLPRLSSSCFVLDSWIPNRKHDNSSGTFHTPVKAEGDRRDVKPKDQTALWMRKRTKVAACTFESLFFLPHTWQNLQRRQHQFSLFSSVGRSAGSRQNWWKGSQHTWQ